MLSLYQDLLDLRRRHPALSRGRYRTVAATETGFLMPMPASLVQNG